MHAGKKTFSSTSVSLLISLHRPSSSSPPSLIYFLHADRPEAGAEHSGSVIRQPLQQTDTQDHDQQPDRHDDEQREPEPPQDHGRGAHARLDAAVAEILCYRAGGDGGGVLPQHGHEHEDGGDEDERQRGLGDGPGRERFDVPLRAPFVDLLVPTWECDEEEEGDEGQDYGDDAEWTY